MSEYEPASLDNGFGYTEALSSRWKAIVSSVAGEPIELLEGIKKASGIVSEIDGRQLFVGNLAINQSPVKYFSLKENKPDDAITKFIGLTALAMVLPDDTERCRLVTALPVNHYFTYKESAQQVYAGWHDVTVNGQQKVFQVEDCRTTVQGLEALFDQILDDSGGVTASWALKPLAVVDIGFYTTNLIVVNRLEPVRRLCKSIPVGVSAAWKLLADFIYKEKGIELNIYELDEIVKAKTVESKGHSWDISDAIVKATNAVSTEIMGQIETLWPQRPYHKIFGAGGGLLQLGDNILPEELEMIQDPQGANSRGGLKLARRETTWQRNCG